MESFIEAEMRCKKAIMRQHNLHWCREACRCRRRKWRVVRGNDDTRTRRRRLIELWPICMICQQGQHVGNIRVYADVIVYASAILLKAKKENEEYEKTIEEIRCKSFLRLCLRTSNPRVGTCAKCEKRKVEIITSCIKRNMRMIQREATLALIVLENWLEKEEQKMTRSRIEHVSHRKRTPLRQSRIKNKPMTCLQI